MERTKYLLIALLMAAAPLCGWAQEDYRRVTYEAYIEGNMGAWEQVMASLEAQDNSTLQQQLELLEYYYGYIGFLISAGDRTQAKTYISKGEALIEEILDEHPSNPDATAYKGSFIAYRFSINKLRAVTSGIESKRLIEKAYGEAPENIRAMSEMANLLYYAPALFGRDRGRGAQLYAKAVRRMEETGNADGNWFYLHLLTNIAAHYDSVGDVKRAAEIYRKILRIEPGYRWVRDELYPDFVSRNGL